MKAKIIAFAYQKGGVGKTATSLTVGKELARQGKKVLLVDMDSQASLTKFLVGGLKDEQKTLTEYLGVMGRSSPFDDVVMKLDDVDLLPSSSQLFAAEQFLTAKPNYGYILNRELEKVRDKYDYIVLDCPPSLGTLMTNAFLASDYIVITVKADPASAASIADFFATVADFTYAYGKEFEAGLLLTMTDSRGLNLKESKSRLEVFAENIGFKIFDTTIRQAAPLARFLEKGQNVVESKMKVGEDYKAFVKELLEEIGG